MAITGIGTKFRRWNTSSGIWEEIGEITNISGPSPSRETIDTTTLNTVGGYRTFIGGLRTGGSVQLSMNFTRATYEIMKADFESDTNQNYEIILPDSENTTLEFEALVTEIPLDIPVGLMTANVTLQISGSVALESGSGPSALA